MLNRLKEYVCENKYKIIISEDGIYAVNYSRIITFSDDVLILELCEKMLTIKGKNIVINKLLDNEILIQGNIKSTDIR
ncbi:MAG TPA: YabP/YqfC family sporulation protein [Bacilli bacterium]|nr:YabP/YqfC family sporulation protein [Bacilli bacterium]